MIHKNRKESAGIALIILTVFCTSAVLVLYFTKVVKFDQRSNGLFVLLPLIFLLGIGLLFSEKISGYLAKGEAEKSKGDLEGPAEHTTREKLIEAGVNQVQEFLDSKNEVVNFCQQQRLALSRVEEAMKKSRSAIDDTVKEHVVNLKKALKDYTDSLERYILMIKNNMAVEKHEVANDNGRNPEHSVRRIRDSVKQNRQEEKELFRQLIKNKEKKEKIEKKFMSDMQKKNILADKDIVESFSIFCRGFTETECLSNVSSAYKKLRVTVGALIGNVYNEGSKSFYEGQRSDGCLDPISVDLKKHYESLVNRLPKVKIVSTEQKHMKPRRDSAASSGSTHRTMSPVHPSSSRSSGIQGGSLHRQRISPVEPSSGPQLSSASQEAQSYDAQGSYTRKQKLQAHVTPSQVDHVQRFLESKFDFVNFVQQQQLALDKVGEAIEKSQSTNHNFREHVMNLKKALKDYTDSLEKYIVMIKDNMAVEKHDVENDDGRNPEHNARKIRDSIEQNRQEEEKLLRQLIKNKEKKEKIEKKFMSDMQKKNTLVDKDIVESFSIFCKGFTETEYVSNVSSAYKKLRVTVGALIDHVYDEGSKLFYEGQRSDGCLDPISVELKKHYESLVNGLSEVKIVSTEQEHMEPRHGSAGSSGSTHRTVSPVQHSSSRPSGTQSGSAHKQRVSPVQHSSSRQSGSASTVRTMMQGGPSSSTQGSSTQKHRFQIHEQKFQFHAVRSDIDPVVQESLNSEYEVVVFVQRQLIALEKIELELKEKGYVSCHPFRLNIKDLREALKEYSVSLQECIKFIRHHIIVEKCEIESDIGKNLECGMGKGYSALEKYGEEEKTRWSRVIEALKEKEKIEQQFVCNMKAIPVEKSIVESFNMFCKSFTETKCLHNFSSAYKNLYSNGLGIMGHVYGDYGQSFYETKRISPDKLGGDMLKFVDHYKRLMNDLSDVKFVSSKQESEGTNVFVAEFKDKVRFSDESIMDEVKLIESGEKSASGGSKISVSLDIMDLMLRYVPHNLFNDTVPLKDKGQNIKDVIGGILRGMDVAALNASVFYKYVCNRERVFEKYLATDALEKVFSNYPNFKCIIEDIQALQKRQVFYLAAYSECCFYCVNFQASLVACGKFSSDGFEEIYRQTRQELESMWGGVVETTLEIKKKLTKLKKETESLGEEKLGTAFFVGVNFTLNSLFTEDTEYYIPVMDGVKLMWESANTLKKLCMAESKERPATVSSTPHVLSHQDSRIRS